MRISEKFSSEQDKIGLSFLKSFFSLFWGDNDTDSASGNIIMGLLYVFRELNLVTRANGILDTGNGSASGAIDDVNISLFEKTNELNCVLRCPASLGPVCTAKSNGEGLC
jgi:hypothetical protein